MAKAQTLVQMPNIDWESSGYCVFVSVVASDRCRLSQWVPVLAQIVCTNAPHLKLDVSKIDHRKCSPVTAVFCFAVFVCALSSFCFLFSFRLKRLKTFLFSWIVHAFVPLCCSSHWVRLRNEASVCLLQWCSCRHMRGAFHKSFVTREVFTLSFEVST